MFRKIIFTTIFSLAFSFFSLLFVTDVKASIFIENIIEKNIRSSEDYDNYVRKVLYNTSFSITNRDELSSSLFVSFAKDEFFITYKDKQTMNYFTGKFSIFNDNLNMKIEKYYTSSLYGFYSLEDISSNPEKIGTSLSISDSEISLGISSDSFKSLNTTIYVEQKKSKELEDEQQLMILNDSLIKTFRTQSNWRFEDLQTPQNFNYISFYSDNALYLINTYDNKTITLAKCRYTFDSNKLNLIPDKFYKLNKIDGNMEVFDFATKGKTITPDEAKYLLDTKNLSLELFYFEKTNGYYLKVDDYKKIVPTVVDAPNLVLRTPTSTELSKIFNDKFLLKDPNLYLNFSGNKGVLTTKNAEYILDGKFTFNQNKVKFDFSVMNYFIKDKDSVAFFEDDDWDKYSVELEFYYLDDKVVTVITSSDYPQIILKDNILVYNRVQQKDKEIDLSIPTKIEDVELSLTIKNKAFSFTQIDKNNSPNYTVIFDDNSKAKLIIQSKNTTEILEGNYKISGNKIEINNDNKNYAIGNYNDYKFGTIKRSTPNWYITVPIYAKYDHNNNQIYFTIYDGRRYESNTLNYEQTVANGPFYIANRIGNEYDVFDVDKSNETSIEKNLIDSTFTVTSGTVLEKYYLAKDGKVIVTTEAGREFVEYEGKYVINGSSIFIDLNKKYSHNQNGYLTETIENNKITLSIYEDTSKFYLKLYDDIYLNIDNSVTIPPLSTPTSAKKSDIETLLKNKKILYKSNSETLNYTFFKDGKVKKQTVFDNLDGTYKIEDGRIETTFNNKKEIIYIKTDKTNLYLSFNNSKFYIYFLKDFKSVV